ncbi:hypothetical protein KUTeg_001243 [Tegillarca granosa]|uniref:Gamma-glutamylcyclotransferase n=1 Tax=Tegillarca granosa TaxID=220873 RepID=A0ABQ9FVF6_TEGGR|nr:hypothetical protein KUTeg_001243 [Tegillarca granosa]
MTIGFRQIMEIERTRRQLSPASTLQEVGHETSPRLDQYLDSYLAIEADPDLMLEIDFILASQARNASASTKRTISDSWKSTDRIRTYTPVKSRGRPIKPHENEPFLSVDALSLDRLQDSAAGSALSTQSYQKGRSPSVTGTRIGSAHRSPYSCSPTLPPRKVPRKSASAPVRRSTNKREQSSKNTGRYTPGSTIYTSPNKSQNRKVNHHIRSPFKHAVNRPSMTPDGTNTPPTTPAQELKERTALATYHMGKIMSRERQERSKTPTGKLLKGKLKPLEPVVIEGPSIKQCRGIVSDIRSYAASPSRTLSRRRNLIQNIPNVHEYLYERPQTVESIHRTSAASSVDENRDNMIKGDYPEIETDRTDKASYADTEETVPFVPPGSRATTSPATQLDSQRKEISSRGTNDGDPRMFMTEIGSKKNKPELEDMSTNLNEKLRLADLKNGANNNEHLIGEDHRPHTANTDGRHVSPTLSRPHTAGEITGKTKSVRFADDSKAEVAETTKSKAAKDMKNAQIIEQQNRGEPRSSTSEEKNVENVGNEGEEDKKTSSKVSCKPNDMKQSSQKKDDGNDGDPSSGGFGGGSSSGCANSVAGANNNNTNTTPPQNNKTSSADNNGTEKNAKQSTFKSEKSTSDLLITGTLCPQSPRSRSPSPLRTVTRPSSTPTTCDRISRSTRKMPTLQIHSVVHGDGIHTVIGSDCQSHRSRSPSPVRNFQSVSPQRSRKQQNKTTKACTKPSKTNKLVRPSSANLGGRGDKIRYSKSTFTKSLLMEKSASEECLESKKSKVYFEGENPPHSSIFMETGDGSNVQLKENTALTFEDIEAELNAIKDNIIEKRQFEDAVEVDIESYSDSNDSGTVKFDEDIFEEEIETISSEYIEKETWRDYTDLLDVYRKKCMEVSEKCGEMSEWLTSPRKLFRDRPKSATSRHSGLVSRRRSSTSGIGSTLQETIPSGSVHYINENKQVLQRTVSDTTISDSGCSTGNHSDSTLKNEEPINGYNHRSVPDIKINHVTENDKKNDVSDKIIEFSYKIPPGNKTIDTNSADSINNCGIDMEDKPLLEMVCDELSDVYKNNVETQQKSNVESVKDPLKVVATAKKMSKPKPNKNQKNNGPIAPFAPVCFKINARPPTGYMYYFAYGTDMNPARLSTYIRRDVKRFWGLLFGFQMVFNKKGADIEAGGFANIEFNPFFSTEGCIYAITSQELELLDKHVGYPEHYEHLVLPVWLMNSSDPDEYSVAQYCVPAVTYIAQEQWIANEGEHLNCDYTLSQCVKSSDLLTKPYRDHMISMNSPIREHVVSA